MKKEQLEIEKMNMVCFYLIKKANETNAETMTINQKTVTYLGKSIGDWEIIVKKK